MGSIVAVYIKSQGGKFIHPMSEPFRGRNGSDRVGDYAEVVEKILEGEKIPFDPDMIEIWQNIIALRNAVPIHACGQSISVLEFFGATFPIDYQQLWENILDKFLYSFNKFEVLASLSNK